MKKLYGKLVLKVIELIGLIAFLILAVYGLIQSLVG